MQAVLLIVQALSSLTQQQEGKVVWAESTSPLLISRVGRCLGGGQMMRMTRSRQMDEVGSRRGSEWRSSKRRSGMAGGRKGSTRVSRSKSREGLQILEQVLRSAVCLQQVQMAQQQVQMVQ